MSAVPPRDGKARAVRDTEPSAGDNQTLDAFTFDDAVGEEQAGRRRPRALLLGLVASGAALVFSAGGLLILLGVLGAVGLWSAVADETRTSSLGDLHLQVEALPETPARVRIQQVLFRATEGPNLAKLNLRDLAALEFVIREALRDGGLTDLEAREVETTFTKALEN